MAPNRYTSPSITKLFAKHSLAIPVGIVVSIILQSFQLATPQHAPHPGDGGAIPEQFKHKPVDFFIENSPTEGGVPTLYLSRKRNRSTESLDAAVAQLRPKIINVSFCDRLVVGHIELSACDAPTRVTMDWPLKIVCIEVKNERHCRDSLGKFAPVLDGPALGVQER